MKKPGAMPPYVVAVSYGWDGEMDEAGNIAKLGTRGFCITTTGQADVCPPFDKRRFKFLVNQPEQDTPAGNC